ncbi:hypothetical protein HDA44_003223 [Kribbella solani]|uniref:Uncharacterized protein n=1 Tax=Kribbella solani TaxID=236067 RepID=A0A841DMW8_9ACTN|nr:hypothetical protein [Kribbella solani]
MARQAGTDFVGPNVADAGADLVAACDREYIPDAPIL